MALLDRPLQYYPIHRSVQQEIIEACWSPASGVTSISTRNRNCHIDHENYFAYYVEQCSLAQHDGGRHVFVRTHRDVLEIAEGLKDPLQNRQSIIQWLANKLTSPEKTLQTEILEASVDLVARLQCMMNIGSLQYGFSGQRKLVWEHGSLKEFLEEYFGAPSLLGAGNVKLPKTFHARNLELIAGIRIFWTDNLDDHLRMFDEDRTVAIFHHVTFLEHQQSNLFPAGFIEETLRSLSLLFPQDECTRKWLAGIATSSRVDLRVARCGKSRASDRQIENFKFWHDRIVILKQVYDDAHPHNLSQWWHDRRNGVQWYTFWVAIVILGLTVFFGIIQSIEGALQVYKAFHPSK